MRSSARTPKVGGDRSAPRVDRFVLAPLLEDQGAPRLARRDHPRAPRRRAALVLTATRGRDGEPRDDDPNARSVTVGHWTRAAASARSTAKPSTRRYTPRSKSCGRRAARRRPWRPRPTTTAARRDSGRRAPRDKRVGGFFSRRRPAATTTTSSASRRRSRNSPQRRRSGCWSSPGGARSAGRMPTRRTSFASRRCTTKN